MDCSWVLDGELVRACARQGSLSQYLSPEPLLQEPWWVKGEAQDGFATPTYAYARNNPVRYTDPTGLAAPCNPGESTIVCCLKNNQYNLLQCVGEGNEDLIPGLAICCARAKAAYDVCIASGKTEGVCEVAASIVLAKCLAEHRTPLKPPLNCGQ